MKIQYTSGYTIIEFMVATTLATLMALGVISIFANQSANLSSEMERDVTSEIANSAFDVINRLLRQAQKNTIQISFPAGGTYNSDSQIEIAKDSINIDFALPKNFPIWPNSSDPFDNNWVRINWNNTDDNKYEIQITNATSQAGLSNLNLQPIAGSDNGKQSQIINLDLWPMRDQTNLQTDPTDPAINGYYLRITTRSATPDLTYSDDAGKHFRTHSVAGIITPRN